jgi:polyhydroxyalkanoate synthesis regulator protein
MTVNQTILDIEEGAEETTSRQIREVIADAYAFIQGAEANKAIATVTLEDLMEDQIKRNGESAKSNASQYNPYSYDSADEPAGEEPETRANFAGGADVSVVTVDGEEVQSRPTKLDRVLAIQAELSSVIELVKTAEPTQVVDAKTYVDSTETGFEFLLDDEANA